MKRMSGLCRCFLKPSLVRAQLFWMPLQPQVNNLTVVTEIDVDYYSLHTFLNLNMLFNLGASIKAAKRLDRHVIGFESDPLIFEALLFPLRNVAPLLLAPAIPIEAVDDDDVPIRRVAKRKRLRKYVPSLLCLHICINLFFLNFNNSLLCRMMDSAFSPPMSFTLPAYAESVTHAFATALSPPIAHRRSRYNPRVCRYLDVEAIEDSDCSST